MAESQYDGTSETRRFPAKRAMAAEACGACKYMKKKCNDDCIFAPYFTTDQGADKFAAVHKVFGASNVKKILSDIPKNYQSQAMETLSYEAEARLSDPIYGCVSIIKALQQQMAALQAENTMLKSQLVNTEFSAYSTAIMQQHQQQLPNFNVEVPVYSNNSPASPNNLMYMNNFNPSTTNLMNVSNSNPGYDFPIEPPQHF